MNNIVQQQNLDLVQVGQIFSQSGMFPDTKSAAQCTTKLIVGQGMGLDPYDSMAGLHIIQGKVVLAANLMSAAIKRNPKYDYTSETDEESSTITFYQWEDGKKKEIGTKTFDMDMAKRAGLAGGVNWKKYPEAMLFARCISAGYKEHCPDALGGAPVYVEAHGETELGVTVEQHNTEMAALPEIVQEAEVIDKPKPRKKTAKKTTKKAAAKKEEPKAEPGFQSPDCSGEHGEGVFHISMVEHTGEFESKSGKKWDKYTIHTPDPGISFNIIQSENFRDYVKLAERLAEESKQAKIGWHRTNYGMAIAVPWDDDYGKNGKIVTGGIWEAVETAPQSVEDSEMAEIAEEMPF